MKIQLPIANFAAQDEALEDQARYVVIPKGRRFGLTTGFKNKLIKDAIQRKFQSALWGDVVNSNIEKYIMRLFMPALKNLPQKYWKWTKNPHTLYIYDSYIDFRSAERPESWEGFGYDVTFLNEAGIILKNPYLWENAVRPMMWDNPKSRVFFGGTPKIGCHVFKELWDRAEDPNQPDYKGYKFSSFDNPYLSRELIKKDMETMGDRVIKQEIYGDFLDDDGVVFRGIERVAILDPNELPDVNYSHMYVMGVDLAKLVDYTVIAVYDRTDNKQVFQMKFNKLEWPTIQGRIQHISRKYNNALVMLDSTGVGEPINDQLSRIGVPVEPIHLTNELKKEIIEKLSNWIELRYITMIKDPDTISEFKSFTYDISEKSDRIIYGAPVGFHDDIVIAHGLAVWGLQPVTRQVPTEEMSVIQRDIINKTTPPEENEFEEVDDWGLYGDSNN